MERPSIGRGPRYVDHVFSNERGAAVVRRDGLDVRGRTLWLGMCDPQGPGRGITGGERICENAIHRSFSCESMLLSRRRSRPEYRCPRSHDSVVCIFAILEYCPFVKPNSSADATKRRNCDVNRPERARPLSLRGSGQAATRTSRAHVGRQLSIHWPCRLRRRT